jgi:hypothetical protein
MANSTPLFVKTHDFNVWLFQHTQRFPKHLRHSYTHRVESCALDFELLCIQANAVRGDQRLDLLQQADATLACLRALLRYALDFSILAGNQFQYAAQCVDELGRLLGAWLKGAGR